MRFSFSTRASRRKPSPSSPKPAPGATATCARFIISMAKRTEPMAA